MGDFFYDLIFDKDLENLRTFLREPICVCD